MHLGTQPRDALDTQANRVSLRVHNSQVDLLGLGFNSMPLEVSTTTSFVPSSIWNFLRMSAGILVSPFFLKTI